MYMVFRAENKADRESDSWYWTRPLGRRLVQELASHESGEVLLDGSKDSPPESGHSWSGPLQVRKASILHQFYSYKMSLRTNAIFFFKYFP